MDSGTKIYAMSVADMYNNEDLFFKAYNMVSDIRKEKTDRYIKYSDKCLSVGAEILLLHALKKRGACVNNLEFIYKFNNKPYLKDKRVFFNISHSDEYVVCVISDCEIGIDIEKIKPVDLKIANRFFTPKEYETIISQNTDSEKTDMFFRLWTLKECFMKMLGLGMKLPLDSFEIAIGETIYVKHNFNKNNYFFHEFDDIYGYKCSVCSELNIFSEKINILKTSDIL